MSKWDDILYFAASAGNLFLANLGQPWAKGYLGAAIVDGTIAAYGILYFLSNQGRPSRWVRDER